MLVLERPVLDVLLPGFTHHVDIGQGEDARISFGAGGLAQMVLPGKPPMHGEWKSLDKGYHVAWSGGPEGAWQIAHASASAASGPGLASRASRRCTMCCTCSLSAAPRPTSDS